jgi:protein-tyrosine-phosphatase
MNIPTLLLTMMIGTALTAAANAAPEDTLESLQPAITTATTGFAKIPQDRQRELKKIALFVQSKIAAGEPAQVTFICTHNSRRSQLAQVWSQTAAAYYGVTGFKAFSGGIEVTASNERTIAALKRAGFAITEQPAEKNPVYLVKYSEKAEPVRSYSKLYNAEGNPQGNYVAAMTCDHADANCPIVQGASLRVPVHYVDPKIADGKPEEAATYDERSRQIASEMFYMMSLVKR